MTESWFTPPARTQFRLWHAGLLIASVAIPLIAAAWSAQKRSAPRMARTDTNIGGIRVIRGKTPSSAVLRVFWIVAVLVGAEVIWDGWFIATELARQAQRPLPSTVAAVAPGARLVLGFLGALALLGGAQRLNLQDAERATRFLFRLVACVVVVGFTAWSRGSVAELMLLMAVAILAAHFWREFATELTPRAAGQALRMLVVCAFLFWAAAKYSRAGNLYVYAFARGQKVQAEDLEFQMRAR